MIDLRTVWIAGILALSASGCSSVGSEVADLVDSGALDIVDTGSDLISGPDDVAPPNDTGTPDPGDVSAGEAIDVMEGDTLDTTTPPECCQDDDDCPGDQECIGGEFESGGRCLPKPTGDGCFDKENCPDKHFCWSPAICSCDMNCISEPGTCLHLPGGCCKGDEKCEEGMKCAHDSEAEMGVCEVLPPAGKCWDPEDCLPDQACVGSHVCPCDADCDLPDLMGDCTPGCEFPCCCTDADCGEGMDCVAPEMGGTCQPSPEAGKCWDEDDCYPTQECLGATSCPCDAVCGQITAPGTCTPLPTDCCYTDSDCGDGLVCRGALDFAPMPGSCVADPEGPQCPGDFACCWDDSDCFGVGTCQGAYFCGCIELCFNCGACAEFQMGACS